MTAGQDTKMLRGAIWACVLPMALGFMLLAFIIYDLVFYMQLRFIVRTHHFFTQPTAACFILGTPLAAWLACWYLKKFINRAKLRYWRSSALAALLGATSVHFVAAITYAVVVALFVDMSGGGYDSSQYDKGFWDIFFSMMTFHWVIWLFITLPLSLICATIFWRVTKFPKDTSVF